MAKKSFSGPKSLSVKKSGKISGVKGCGGFKGRVKQGGPTKPKKSQTNP